MFEIERKFTFEAGHILVHHDGRCSQPHGHSYKISISLHSENIIDEGPKKNMVFDYFFNSWVVAIQVANTENGNVINVPILVRPPIIPITVIKTQKITEKPKFFFPIL